MAATEGAPTEDDLDERFVLEGDPEEALRRLLTVPVPPVPEPDDDEGDQEQDC